MITRHFTGRLACGWISSALALAMADAGAQQYFAALDDLRQLSIEQLVDVEITTVSRRPEPLSQAPAAIFIVTSEDIRRSGALSVPEALRLAPNLQVARADAAGYAITARGFNHATTTANKLQVLIDGRSVYTPLYSGVFWDAQNVMLDDVERIEVISGPGGTLWGANAVNGVINVLSRDAHETQGLLANANGGERDLGLSVRYGGKIGQDAAFRIYGLGFRRGPSDTATGAKAADEWQNLQGGFRTDWSSAANKWTLQGDIYHGSTEPTPGAVRDTAIDGGNLLGRWTHRWNTGTAIETQAYYDNARRTVSSGILAEVDTWVFDSQLTFAPTARHEAIVGGGYRLTEDRFVRGPGTSFLDPADRELQLWHLFLQDSFAVVENVHLTLGLKVEHNDYTGLEYMPNALLDWQVSSRTLAWASVSRAVRTPARFDRDLINPGLLAGGPDFESEDVVAWELGFRGQPTTNTSFSISTFYNVYDELRTVEATTPFVFPLVVGNGMSGETYGAEIWGSYAPLQWWRLSAGASVLKKKLQLDTGSRDVFGVQFAGNDPEFQASLRSQMNFTPGIEFDLFLRYVDDLPSPAVPDYTELNARLGWQVSDNIELSVTGNNLLNENHREFAGTSTPARQIHRTIYAGTRIRF